MREVFPRILFSQNVSDICIRDFSLFFFLFFWRQIWDNGISYPVFNNHLTRVFKISMKFVFPIWSKHWLALTHVSDVEIFPSFDDNSILDYLMIDFVSCTQLYPWIWASNWTWSDPNIEEYLPLDHNIAVGKFLEISEWYPFLHFGLNLETRPSYWWADLSLWA